MCSKWVGEFLQTAFVTGRSLQSISRNQTVALADAIRSCTLNVVPPKLQLVRKRWAEVAEVLLPAHGRRSRKREQVSAVCYRIRKFKIEFLLVHTRKGRWTFPKGGVVRGLSRAQSAALEAFEEAGVHGRIEQASFMRYSLRKRSSESAIETITYAHLCEVLRLSAPEEPKRHPTWCSPEKTRLYLSQGRSARDAAELARVVFRALSRIERLRQTNGNGSDPLGKVKFESSNDRPAAPDSSPGSVPQFCAGAARATCADHRT